MSKRHIFYFSYSDHLIAFSHRQRLARLTDVVRMATPRKLLIGFSLASHVTEMAGRFAMFMLAALFLFWLVSLLLRWIFIGRHMATPILVVVIWFNAARFPLCHYSIKMAKIH